MGNNARCRRFCSQSPADPNFGGNLLAHCCPLSAAASHLWAKGTLALIALLCEMRYFFDIIDNGSPVMDEQGGEYLTCKARSGEPQQL